MVSYLYCVHNLLTMDFSSCCFFRFQFSVYYNIVSGSNNVSRPMRILNIFCQVIRLLIDVVEKVDFRNYVFDSFCPFESKSSALNISFTKFLLLLSENKSHSTLNIQNLMVVFYQQTNFSFVWLHSYPQ